MDQRKLMPREHVLMGPCHKGLVAVRSSVRTSVAIFVQYTGVYLDNEKSHDV